MIYFDNAATTFPKPETVAKAMYDAVNLYGANPGRSGHFLSVKAAEEVYSCRELAADLFNAEVENIIFTQNATMSINMAMKGLKKPKSHIIISDLEHNSVLRPVTKLGENNINFSIFNTDGSDDKIVKNIESLINKKTCLIITTHGSNVTGKILPINKIGELAKKHKIKFVVDASQTGGLIDIDIIKCNIDCLCLPGHKSLLGPMGTGILIINKNINLYTLLEGGTGTSSVNAIQPDFSPERYESGTLNLPGIAGLKQGLIYIKSVGINEIYKKESEIAKYAYNSIKQLKNYKIYSEYPENNCPILSFGYNNKSSTEISDILNSKEICVRSGIHCSPLAHKKLGTINGGLIRASFGCFNDIKEVDNFIKVLKTV